MGSQVDLLICDAEFLTDIVPVKQNRIFGQQEQLSHLLVGLALSH